MYRPVLLAALLVSSGIALLPVAQAGCLAQVHGICVRDPGTDPCASVVACDVCLSLGICVHVDNCLEGEPGCIDPGACTCDPITSAPRTDRVDEMVARASASLVGALA